MMYDDLPIKQKKRDFPWHAVKLPKGKSSRLVFLIKIHIPSVEGQHQRLPEKLKNPDFFVSAVSYSRTWSSKNSTKPWCYLAVLVMNCDQPPMSDMPGDSQH